MKQQCPDCASGGVFGVGNGKCSKCYGGGKAGTFADEIAGGKPSCPRCHGTGRCPTCGGSGLVSGSAAATPERPHAEGRKAPPREVAGSSATPLESAWFGLCDSSEFIPKHIVDYYVAALSAEGSHAEIVVGLSDFVGHTCPNCKDEGQFKVHFLGRLEHPACHWAGYMGTGSYIAFQITKILHSGIRAGGSMKEDSDKKGEGGGWIYAIFGFLVVGMFRAALAVVLIPPHTIVALCQPKQPKSDVVMRVIVLLVFAATIGICTYEIDAASNQQATASQPAGIPSYVTVSRCHACAWAQNWQSDILQPLARAGFQTVTGLIYRGGGIAQQPPTNWAVDVIVGPFSNDTAARTAMRRLIPILRPIASAHMNWNAPDAIGEDQADFAGYMLLIVK